MFRCCLSAFDYPRFIPSESLPGPYQNVSLVRSRVKIPQKTPSSQSSVLVSVMYPSSQALSKSDGDALRYWRAEAVLGLGDYSGMPHFMGQHLSTAPHPCGLQGCQILPKPLEEGWPVVIFSHGLAGCADMYSQICRCLASFGYIVCALEHEDGSGSYAHDELTDTVIKYKKPDDSPYTREKVTNFRKPFLDHRVNEICGVISCIGKAKDRNDNDVQNDKNMIHILDILSQGDPKKVNLMGHSFGGATMSLASQSFVSSSFDASSSSSSTNLPLHLNQVEINSLILLDPWAFSLDDEVLQTGLAHIPTLSILSHGWITGEELPQIATLLRPIFKNEIKSHISSSSSSNDSEDIEIMNKTNNQIFTAESAAIAEGHGPHPSLSEKEDATGTASYYLPNTVHQSFSDSPLWFPSILTEKFNMKGQSENPQFTHIAIAEASHIAIKSAYEEKLNPQKIIGSGNFLRKVRSKLDVNIACKNAQLTWFHPVESSDMDVKSLNTNLV